MVLLHLLILTIQIVMAISIVYPVVMYLVLNFAIIAYNNLYISLVSTLFLSAHTSSYSYVVLFQSVGTRYTFSKHKT